jgi:multiple sugar transport system permease protein
MNNRYSKIKRFFLGISGTDGLLVRLLMYALLIGVGFVYIYPVLYMLSSSFQSLDDLLNSGVIWIPTELYLENYVRSLEVLNFWPVLRQTLFISVVPASIQAFVTSVVGYGFARFEFRGKKIMFALVLATFIIPPQVLVIPRYILFNQLGILDSIMAYILPATFGQGLQSAIFILIFYQTFKTIPTALEEAAQLDGAGFFKIFYKIAFPMGSAAYIVSFLFSFVWYWNETQLAAIYFGNLLTTLPLQLQSFVAQFEQIFTQQAAEGININEGIEMAGTLLTIVPLLVIYFMMQRWFVESVDRSGITGE